MHTQSQLHIDQFIVVLTNVPDILLARTIAHQVVDKRLAACVNILPMVQSIYHWQDKIESSSEITLLIKTRHSLYQELEYEIKTLHSYEVPEIIAINISDGLNVYFDWIARETKKRV